MYLKLRIFLEIIHSIHNVKEGTNANVVILLLDLKSIVIGVGSISSGIQSR